MYCQYFVTQNIVDKIRKICYYDGAKNERKWSKIQIKQAVKDTAKEIFELLIKTAQAEYICGLPNPHKGKLPVGILKVFAKERYGVEVE